MSGLFSVNVQEARGLVAVPADIDRLTVVIGCSSAGSGLSPFFLSGKSAVAALGYGDAVDDIAQIIEQKQDNGTTRKYPAAFYTVPGTTPGSYGTIDVTGVTGTAQVAVHSATHPFGTYEAYLRITQGGFIGTPGIEFVDSLSNGRDISRVRALGTATNYTIPNSNVRFDFSPSSADLTALNALINDAFDDYNEHVVLTAGGVHGVADSADVVSNITYPSATDSPTRIARMNALRAAYELHRIKTAGGVHGAPDTTDVITAPVCTDDSTCLLLALNFKAVVNAHMINITGAIHGAADGSSTITAPAPTAGAFAVGDIVRVRTFGPAPASADIDAAFTALAAASIDFRLVVCEWPMTASLAGHVSTGLATLRGVGKRVTAICRHRLPNFESSETDAAWNTSIAADFTAFADSSVFVRAAYGLITDAMTGRQYMRSNLAQYAADVVRVPRSEFPDVPADQPMSNFTLVDANGNTIGHDEGTRGSSTGLSDDSLGNRFCCDMRLPDFARREMVYSTVPWVMYAEDERIRNLPTRRIANSMEAVAVSAGNSGLGGKLEYIPADPAVPGSKNRLTNRSRKALHGVIYRAVSTEFANDIQNASAAGLDTGLVQVDPVVSVSGGNLLTVNVTLAPLVFGYLLNLGIVLSVQE